MIKNRDVITMKIPYPSVSSNLAIHAHMFICKEFKDYNYEYVKCQTLKPKMLVDNPMRHYLDERANPERNPFSHTTRIDCDKLFATYNVEYDDRMKTTVREDVCLDLYRKILSELTAGNTKKINLNEKRLQSINPMIKEVSKPR